MASTGICPFCGAVVTSDEKNCPNCGGENPNYIRDQIQQIIQPKTISELKEYCAERGMPLFRMRFFIGVNVQEPRAFGIYQEGSRFIVYKNKSDGSRTVRYDGTDESYAVNEIYTKLIEECRNRGINPDQPGTSASVQSREQNGTNSKNINQAEEVRIAQKKAYYRRQEERKKADRKKILIIVCVAAAIIAMLIINQKKMSPSSGWGVTTSGYSYTQRTTRNSYSTYDKDYYSNSRDDDWHSNSQDDDWHSNSRDDDWHSNSWDSDWGSNDYDSWDSGGTDWDSDW